MGSTPIRGTLERAFGVYLSMNNAKYCPHCKIDLPLTSFNKNSHHSDGLASECRECKKLYQKAYYTKNSKYEIEQVKQRKAFIRRKLDEYKSNLKCTCGENHIACLQFHHENDDKEINIGEAPGRGWSWERILLEIQKCIVMCANCHFKLHYIKKNENKIP